MTSYNLIRPLISSVIVFRDKSAIVSDLLIIIARGSEKRKRNFSCENFFQVLQLVPVLTLEGGRGGVRRGICLFVSFEVEGAHEGELSTVAEKPCLLAFRVCFSRIGCCVLDQRVFL